MIAQGVIGLFGQLLGIFGAQGKAKQQALSQVAANMQRTWVDEIVCLYWFLPTILAVFGWPEGLERQQAMIGDGSYLFQTQVGITAAVFGLGKIAGKR